MPKHFFKKKVLLEGTVINVEAAKEPYLLVDHKPVVRVPRLGKPKYLPVKIAGVEITGNGMFYNMNNILRQNLILLTVNFNSSSKELVGCKQ